MDDFAFLDATAQADLVRRKQVKPIELVDAAIERIERLNPSINAVVTPMYDIARGAASGTLPDGPFAGVPFLLKDLSAAYAGVSLTSGSAFLKDYVPGYDSELVVALEWHLNACCAACPRVSSIGCANQVGMQFASIG